MFFLGSCFYFSKLCNVFVALFCKIYTIIILLYYTKSIINFIPAKLFQFDTNETKPADWLVPHTSESSAATKGGIENLQQLLFENCKQCMTLFCIFL